MVILPTAAVLITAAAICMAAPAQCSPDYRGNDTTETRSTGSPDNPRGFGSVTSQRAVDDHDIGEHVRSQITPHLGVGNVAANDGPMFDATGVPDTGTRPGDHAAGIGALTGYDPYVRPGTHE